MSFEKYFLAFLDNIFKKTRKNFEENESYKLIMHGKI